MCYFRRFVTSRSITNRIVRSALLLQTINAHTYIRYGQSPNPTVHELMTTTECQNSTLLGVVSEDEDKEDL